MHFNDFEIAKYTFFSSHISYFSLSGSATCATGATCRGPYWRYFCQLLSSLFIGAGGCQIFSETLIVMSMD